MATELDTGLPSVRHLQTLIRDNKEVELKLVTGDVVTGRLRWQDPHCMCLFDQYDQPMIIWKQSIAYVKSKT